MHRIEEVIARGMYIGCGACVLASDGGISVSLSAEKGIYQASLKGAEQNQVRAGSRVCPYSDESPNEDALVAPNGDDGMIKDARLGQVSRTFAGRVADEEYNWGSSSGGLTSWLLSRLLQEGSIDAVINVGVVDMQNRGEIFAYSVSGELDVLNKRKSQYYATTMADVFSIATSGDLRFAVVGVPCYIRAARALCVEKPELRKNLVFFVGLVCGHLKTQDFSNSMAWQIGVKPGELAEVDFRVKDPAAPADRYRFGARRHGAADWVTAPSRELVGANWGHGAFQPEACNFCDDVVGETADVSFGDAWLPQFKAEPRGTNVVVSRNRLFDQMFEAAENSGVIETYDLTTDAVVESQAGGFRFRRDGLAVRLSDDIKKGLSVPRKRVQPNGRAVSRGRARLLRQRRFMAKASQEVFQRAKDLDDLSIYLSFMQREIRRYVFLDKIHQYSSKDRFTARIRMVRTRIRGVVGWYSDPRGCAGG